MMAIKKNYVIINKNLFLLIVIILVSACESTPKEPGLCEWFNKSQEIRTKRIPAILIIQDVYKKYGSETLDYSNPAMVNDMVNAMKEYISYNDDFIREWNELGSNQSGKTYWENELKAVDLFNAGFTKSISGIENQDINSISEGIKMYESAVEASNRAESEMIAIRQKCK